MSALPPAERRARLRLFRSENVGPVTFRRLLDHFGSAEAALEALPDLARRGGRKAPVRLASDSAIDEELENLARIGASLVVWGDPLYPLPLAATDDAPPAFAVLGDARMPMRPAIAIVGARNASLNGKRFARDIAEALGSAGLVVVSGLARGIDGAAHEGAIATGTVAVLAGGVDVVYPQENRALYDGIVERGAVVSEMAPGTQPLARHFPQRNRIISGLALGTIVVEAALQSGSLITARRALDQGREVFAVPGSPLDPRARGANDLLRQGATLVESAGDVLAVLDPQRPLPQPASLPKGPESPPQSPISQDVLTAARYKILESLNPSPLPVDELVRRCQLSPATVSLALLELELAGRIARHPGNQVSKL
jgi:DNA processing protein